MSRCATEKKISKKVVFSASGDFFRLTINGPLVSKLYCTEARGLLLAMTISNTQLTFLQSSKYNKSVDFIRRSSRNIIQDIFCQPSYTSKCNLTSWFDHPFSVYTIYSRKSFIKLSEVSLPLFQEQNVS